jgi:hypothetical protein
MKNRENRKHRKYGGENQRGGGWHGVGQRNGTSRAAAGAASVVA